MRLSDASRIVLPSFDAPDGRVKICGGRHLDRPGGITVDAIFPTGADARFGCWSATANDMSGLTSFVVPRGVWFSIHRSPFGATSDVTLARRGIYVIAFRETEDDAVPRWNEIQLDRDEHRVVAPALAASHVIVEMSS